MWIYYLPGDGPDQFSALLCLETGASIGIIKQGDTFAFNANFPDTRSVSISPNFTSREAAEKRLLELAVKLQASILTEPGCPFVRPPRAAPSENDDNSAVNRLRGRKQGYS